METREASWILDMFVHYTIFLNAAETFPITSFILRTTNPSDLLFPLPFKYNLHHTDSLITSLLISLSLAHALHTRQVWCSLASSMMKGNWTGDTRLALRCGTLYVDNGERGAYASRKDTKGHIYLLVRLTQAPVS